ncbi:MAG: hypothetical protein GX559_03255 [Candidatus Pacebacteria bacterium]|nr:hypothetical protein [Candidatus Paceibacterota bacterium]
MAITKLPTFEKYTVDLKLRQFRFINKKQKLKIIHFDTKRGKKILKKISINRFTNESKLLKE